MGLSAIIGPQGKACRAPIDSAPPAENSGIRGDGGVIRKDEKSSPSASCGGFFHVLLEGTSSPNRLPMGICRDILAICPNLARPLHSSVQRGRLHPLPSKVAESSQGPSAGLASPLRGMSHSSAKTAIQSNPQPLCGGVGTSRYNPHELSFPCLPGKPCRSPGGNSCRLLAVLAAPLPGAVREQHASGGSGNRLPGKLPNEQHRRKMPE